MAEKATIQVREIRSIEPNSLLQSAIENGSSVETLEKLLALAKDVRAEQAREAFNRAFAEFQSKCPIITKTRTAKIGTSYKYSYTPLEDIISAIVPVMTPLGLSVSYRMGGTKDSVHAVAIITHELGHFKESGEIHMPIPQGGSGANPAQCVGIAATYARRYALLAVTGISPQDDDPDAQPPREVETSPGFQKAHENLRNEPLAAEVVPDAYLITVPQQKRLYAIAKTAGWSDDAMKRELLDKFKFDSSKKITRDKYDTICLFFQGGGTPPAEQHPDSDLPF